MKLTGELSQIEQYCPEWAKELLAEIIRLPRVTNIYSLENMTYLLKKELEIEKEQGVLKDGRGRPRFHGPELHKMRLWIDHKEYYMKKFIEMEQKKMQDEQSHPGNDEQ